MTSRFGIRLIALLLTAAAPLMSSAAPAAGQDTFDAMLRLLQSVQADPERTAAALKEGKNLASVCAYCHGANGYSVLPDTPNLAGQNPRYLFKQMEKFVDGRRRYAFMEGMIRVMTPQERISTVLFYSRQNVPPRPGDDADRLARGKAYFNKVCFRCHGPDGRGNEDYARLAGQQPSYMTLALQRYRNNSDGMRNDPMMADVVKMMNDADISAVAAYVASLP